MRFLPAAACALFLFSTSVCALELVTEDDVPYNTLKDGKVVGSSTEKLEEAFKRIGIAPHIKLMSWTRAYQAALTLPGHCVYSAARTPEREALFQWAGPIISIQWILYTRADNPVKITKLEQVRKEIIGGYPQDVISVWLTANGYQVDDSANSDELNPKKLLAGRFNYWATDNNFGSAALAKSNLRGLIVPALTFGHSELYLACHRSVPADLVKKIDRALHQIAEDGTAAKIDARYAP